MFHSVMQNQDMRASIIGGKHVAIKTARFANKAARKGGRITVHSYNMFACGLCVMVCGHIIKEQVTKIGNELTNG